MENETMELIPQWACSRPAVVDQNLVDLSARLLRITDTVKALPKTRENLPEVKKLRAEMRKYFETLETQRKQVKADVMAPYLQAESVYKDLVSEPIKKADALCKSFVEAVEGAAKKECEDTLRAYFTELCQMKGIYWLPFERLGIKVDMAMANQKEPRKAKDYIYDFVQNVDRNLAAISGMENATDILDEYTRTLDLAQAIANTEQKKQQREELEHSQRSWEERRSQRAVNASQVTDALKEQAAPRITVTGQEKLLRTTFTVTATMPMLRGLKAFLDSHNYEYQEVTENG